MYFCAVQYHSKSFVQQQSGLKKLKCLESLHENFSFISIWICFDNFLCPLTDILIYVIFIIILTYECIHKNITCSVICLKGAFFKSIIVQKLKVTASRSCFHASIC